LPPHYSSPNPSRKPQNPIKSLLTKAPPLSRALRAPTVPPPE